MALPSELYPEAESASNNNHWIGWVREDGSLEIYCNAGSDRKAAFAMCDTMNEDLNTSTYKVIAIQETVLPEIQLATQFEANVKPFGACTLLVTNTKAEYGHGGTKKVTVDMEGY